MNTPLEAMLARMNALQRMGVPPAEAIFVEARSLIMNMSPVGFDLKGVRGDIHKSPAAFNAALASINAPREIQCYLAGAYFFYQGSSLPQPTWNGDAFPGRTLFLYTDWGLGDTILFYRYVPLVMQLGNVVLKVKEPLARFLAAQPGAPSIVVQGQPLPPFDLHCPLASLPWILGGDIPQAPYIKNMYEDSTPAPARCVGISWAGNPEHSNDHNRSMSLRTMLMMLDTNMEVVSLQKIVPEGDRGLLGHVIDLSSTLSDLYVTASVIAKLDLVITVDTSVAHLAGALGKPVWILLPFKPDGMWLPRGETTPWYPSARLFRQEAPGDWAGVIRQVREALRKRL